jgi:DNA processing protein
LIAIRAPRLGGQKLAGLVRSFGSIERFVGAPAAELRQAGLADSTIHGLQHPDPALLQSDLAWLQAPGQELIPFDDERYPALLAELPHAPAALFVAGDVDALWQPQLAVIGSRNPTAGGLENARDFAGTLARQGFTITSGLALGIDGAAHQAALDAGAMTVAVLGSGLDEVYPSTNRRLAERIRERGALVSEFPPGTHAQRSHFPSRNRIISGLSLGVLVIEAALNSGSLITARLAAEQGREVFALPGSIHNPLAKGCHRLIREGARLVETDAEILQELAPLAGRLAASLREQVAGASPASDRLAALLNSKPWPKADEMLVNSGSEPNLADDPDYAQLWDCLGHDPVPVDTLIASSGLTAKAVSAMLLMLELRGRVEAHPGGAFSRKTRGL